MKAFLMERGRTFALHAKAAEKLPPNAEFLVQDLELGLLLQAMAQGDEYVFQVARQVILAATRSDVSTIRYRQAVLKDCLAHPTIVKELYAIAVEAIARANARCTLGYIASRRRWCCGGRARYWECLWICCGGSSK